MVTDTFFVVALSSLEMNGGTGSKLPPRNPLARPVSFHSLSEHQRNGPTYQSPYSRRRPRTPGSSPLAGPPVSSDQTDGENKDDEAGQKPRYRPNRISSIPDVVVPIQPLYDSDATSLSSPSSSPPSTVSNGSNGIVISRPPFPRSYSSSSSGEDDKEKELNKGRGDIEDGNKLHTFTKRLWRISLSSLTTVEKDKDDEKLNDQHHSLSLHSASTTSLPSTLSSRTVQTDRTQVDGTSQTVPPIPTIPRWALNAMREEAGIANRSMDYGHRPGTSDDLTALSSSPLPNQLVPRGAPLSVSGLSNQPRPPSTSRDSVDSWMSMADSTPTFSRLGLNGVVMPVSKENLARMRTSSMGSTRSTATISQSASARPDSGVMSKTEPSPGIDSSNDSSAANIKANPKEKERLRKRGSLPSSLKEKISWIGLSSSAGSENIPPLPPIINKSGFPSTSVTTSHTSSSTSNDSAPKIVKTSISPPSIIASPDFTRRSATLGRDCVPIAIGENQLPSFSPNDSFIEFGRTADVKPQDTQKTKTRRMKNIKQIVMQITASPTSAGEKLKLTAIHDSRSTPVMVVPPDTLMPLDPPPIGRFGKPTNSSVQSLPSTKELPEFGYSKSGGKRFKAIRKRWDAIFSNVRG